MNGLVRKPVPVVGVKVTLLYGDGHTETADLDWREAARALEGAGYRIPRRWHEERDVRAFTNAELAEALRMFRQGLSWQEIGEAYGVPWEDLRHRVRRAEHDRFGNVVKELRRERDSEIMRLWREGVSRPVIAERMGVSATTVGRVINRGAMRDIDIQRGYVLSDSYNDTHGFRRTSKRAWCRFRSTQDEGELPRAVWVDYLGDYYVLDFELEHFEKLGGEEVWDYHIEPEGGC